MATSSITPRYPNPRNVEVQDSDNAPLMSDTAVAQANQLGLADKSTALPDGGTQKTRTMAAADALAERGAPRDLDTWANQHGELTALDNDKEAWDEEATNMRGLERSKLRLVQAPQPVTVKYPSTSTHPDGPIVSFPSIEHAQKFGKDVWNQLSTAASNASQVVGGPASMIDMQTSIDDAMRDPVHVAGAVVGGVLHGLNSAVMMLGPGNDENKAAVAKANEAWAQGNHAEAAAHLIPLVGEGLAKSITQARNKQYAAAIGTAVGTAAPFVVPALRGEGEAGAAAESAGETEAAATRESAMPPRTSAATSANISTEQASSRVQRLLADAKRADAQAAAAKARGAGEVAPVSVPKMIKPVEPDVEVIAHQNLTEAPQKPTSQTMEHVGDKPRTSEELQKTAGEFLQKQVKPGESRVIAETVEPKEATTATQAEIDEAANKEISKLKKSPSGKPNVSFETHEGQFINRHRASINIGKAGEVGHVEAVSDPANPDAWRINSVDLDSEFRGKGLGVQAYEKLAKEAEKAGVSKLESGGSVSPEAQNVWGALKRRGYTVQKIGTAENPQFVLHLEPKVKPTANLTNEWQQSALEQLGK